MEAKLVAEEILLKENPIYLYRVPLAIILTIILVWCINKYFPKLHSYLSMVIIPLFLFMVILIILESWALSMISQDVLEERAKEIQKTEEGFFNFMNWFQGEDYDKDAPNEVDATSQQNVQVGQINVLDNNPNFNDEAPANQEGGFSGTAPCLNAGDKFSQVCSGQLKSVDLIAPVPGPQWQVQSAEYVQQRLVNGNFVPSKGANN